MPGESRTLSVKYELSGRQGDLTRVGVDGFNVVQDVAQVVYTSDASGTVGGTVPATLSLALGAPAALRPVHPGRRA